MKTQISPHYDLIVTMQGAKKKEGKAKAKAAKKIKKAWNGDDNEDGC